MKISYTDKPKKGFRQINLYTKDSEKKSDTKTNLYLNYKIKKEYTRRTYITLIRTIMERAKAHSLEHVCISFADIAKLQVADTTIEDKAHLLVSNMLIGQYRYDKFMSKKKPNVKEVQVVGKLKASVKKAAKEAETIVLNLKPGKSMDEMAMDMTGGATALSALHALVKLGVKKNIIAIVPAVENAISGASYRPGDIIKSMSGKTVQIGNTDAEGRLVLADSITYAKRYDPKVLVDIATLTGASLVAVGDKASVVMTKSRDLEDTFRTLGEKTGDYVWPLPTWEEFEADIKAPFADLLNIGKTRYGGCITAGMFLAEFAKDLKKTDWVHLDIAPRMESSGHDHLEKGATGEPVRLLVEFVRNYR